MSAQEQIQLQQLIDQITKLNQQVERLTSIIEQHLTNHPSSQPPKYGPIPTFPVVPFTPTMPINPLGHLERNGCQVCGLGVGPNGEAIPMGYVCSRNDCPSRVTCQS